MLSPYHPRRSRCRPRRRSQLPCWRSRLPSAGVAAVTKSGTMTGRRLQRSARPPRHSCPPSPPRPWPSRPPRPPGGRPRHVCGAGRRACGAGGQTASPARSADPGADAGRYPADAQESSARLLDYLVLELGFVYAERVESDFDGGINGGAGDLDPVHPRRPQRFFFFFAEPAGLCFGGVTRPEA